MWFVNDYFDVMEKKEVIVFIVIDFGVVFYIVDYDIIFIKYLFNYLYEFLINVF